MNAASGPDWSGALTVFAALWLSIMWMTGDTGERARPWIARAIVTVGLVGATHMARDVPGLARRTLTIGAGTLLFFCLVVLAIAILWVLAQPRLLGGLSASIPLVMALSCGTAGAVAGVMWGAFATVVAKRSRTDV